MRKLITTAALAIVMALPVGTASHASPDARGGEGWWPQTATK